MSEDQKLSGSATGATRRPRAGLVVLCGVLLLAGLAIRAALPLWSMRSQQVGDHFFIMGFGLTAQQHGLLKVYSVPGEQNASVSGRVFRQGEWEDTTLQYPMRIVFPPLLVTLLWAQVHVLGAIDPQLTANTLTARWVMQVPSVLAEIVLAAGVFMVGRQFLSRRRAFAAAAICWLFPPLAMDSSFWGQTDMLPLAPGIFVVYFLLRRRWVSAGVCLGLAFMLKPQGALFGPIGLLAAAIVPPDGPKLTLGRFAVRAGKFLGAAAVVIAVVTLPWTIADGLHWFSASCLEYFRYHRETTLQALNLWYLDALRLDTRPVPDAISSTVPLLGLSKDLWGRLLLAAASIAIVALCWRKYRRRPVGLVVFAGLWLWSTFMLPTRAVDRYIVYCMPFVILSVLAMPRLVPALIGLAIIGTAEMTWTEWAHLHAGHFSRRAESLHQVVLEVYRQEVSKLPADQRPPPVTRRELDEAYWPAYSRERDESRDLEYVLTILSLLAYAYALPAALVGRAPRDPPDPAVSEGLAGTAGGVDAPCGGL